MLKNVWMSLKVKMMPGTSKCYFTDFLLLNVRQKKLLIKILITSYKFSNGAAFYEKPKKINLHCYNIYKRNRFSVMVISNQGIFPKTIIK